MDRVDIAGTNAVPIRLRASESASISQVERVRPASGGAATFVEAPVSRDALAGTEPPIDQDRVDGIRKALEEGRYPVVPARIADAMIAAGYISRAK